MQDNFTCKNIIKLVNYSSSRKLITFILRRLIAFCVPQNTTETTINILENTKMTTETEFCLGTTIIINCDTQKGQSKNNLIPKVNSYIHGRLIFLFHFTEE